MEQRHNLNLFPGLPKDVPAYLCPLCHVQYLFIQGNQVSWTTEFTMDHYLAENVGGKRMVLVCKKCNSTLGSKIDSHLPNGLSARHFFNQKGYMPITISVNKKGTYRLDGSLEGQKINV